MTRRVTKVFCYVTADFDGPKLLVFSQPHSPAAGIQVPAGTVKPAEPLEVAALREAHEETGLEELHLVRKLGIREFDMREFGRDELHVRHFFQLAYSGVSPARWIHEETSGGERAPISFELFWVGLPDQVPALIAGHGALLDQL
jgi:8-oxo-dGTP diphosphatase